MSVKLLIRERRPPSPFLNYGGAEALGKFFRVARSFAPASGAERLSAFG